MGNRSLFPGVAVPRAFFGTFFRFERKYYPSRGGSPTIRAVVGASGPNRGNGYAPAGAPKGFPLALWKPSDAKVGKKPMGRQVPLPRRRRRVKPGRKKGLRLRAHQRAFRSPFGNLRASKPAKNPWKLHPLHSWQNGRTPPKARGCPRGKRSVRPALPCAPLVGCLNSESFPPSVRAFHRVASSFLAIAGKVS